MHIRTDDELKFDVEQELTWDARTWDQKIKAQVKDGIVTLDGVVPGYAQRQAAEDAAHKVFGVKDVANEIMVKIPRHFSDVEIARSVRQALESNAFVPDAKITSTVSSGWVKLRGEVDSLNQRSSAEGTVENLAGVAGVINQIEIEGATANVQDLQDSIEAALERRADREAERLRIEIVNKEINLFGRVHSLQEREAVLGSISHARPGIKKINDHLRVDPYF